MLLKVKWRESVWIQPRPVKYWHGALWRTISSYQSMWKWLIVLAAKRIPNWKACYNIWICHNTLLSLEFITLPSCACFHIVHRCWCLRRTTPCSSKTLWLSLYLKWQGDEICSIRSFLKFLHLVLGEHWQILSRYQSANRENCFFLPPVNNLGQISSDFLG